MRAGLSTIQQTLTPEAASVLNNSIAEAGRRNHGQTTPLHVAATLLSSPTGYLRQACIKSHPNSSHPLQCRALELCFSVALERLPTAQNSGPGGLEPPISNALMAALKRAQAHQRRGCPEQQQQPLLAVKVELEQLIISILDDPSVSRVMREASFSSPAVKATIEQSLSSSSASTVVNCRPATISLPTGPGRSLYLNPRLQQQEGSSGGVHQSSGKSFRRDEVKRVIDILLRMKKRNPVLVGETEPEMVMKEVLRKIENHEEMKNVRVIHLEKEVVLSDKAQMASKIKELGGIVDTQMAEVGNGNGTANGGGIVLDLGDLKWLVEPGSFVGGQQQRQQAVSEGGRVAVAEMGKLLGRFREEGNLRLWLIGRATCETYLRCQVYHPSMEIDWDLQAMPVAARAPLPGLFPRIGGTGILSSSVESLSPMKSFLTTTIAPMRLLSRNLDPSVRKTNCCPQCLQSYEQELAEIGQKESSNSSPEAKPESAQSALPQWLQNAKANDHNNTRVTDQTQTQKLQKKWHDTCLRLHPSFQNPNKNIGPQKTVPMPLSITGLCNMNLLGQQGFQPKLQSNNKSLGETLQLKMNPVLQSHEHLCLGSPQRSSPVRTNLVLGQTKEQTHQDRVKDFFAPDKFPSSNNNDIYLSNTLDADSFKNLLKSLIEKVWWQTEAASALATTISRCKLGNGKKRGTRSKGDMWVLFMGPDRMGKEKMASALSESVSGSHPVMISLGSSQQKRGESDVNYRGKTALDRISEWVRRNPFSVIVLEDIDKADALVFQSIKQAIERGRLMDSNGREISLGNVIFILTTNWCPDNLNYLSNNRLDFPCQEKIPTLGQVGWQLRLSLCEKQMAKRIPSWLDVEDHRFTKPKTDVGPGLSFDLNEAADVEDDKADGSLNSSDLTSEHETEQYGLNNWQSMTMPSSLTSRELLDLVDDGIVFKPVDFGRIKRKVKSSITKKFSTVLGQRLSIEVEEEALEKIVSGVWVGKTGVEEWTENVLGPTFNELKTRVSSTSEQSLVVRLESDTKSSCLLPGDVKVVVAD